MSPFLTDNEVHQLTGCKRRDKLFRWLKASRLKEGKHFIFDPLTGHPIIFRWWIEGRREKPEPASEPDFSSLGGGG